MTGLATPLARALLATGAVALIAACGSSPSATGSPGAASTSVVGPTAAVTTGGPAATATPAGTAGADCVPAPAGIVAWWRAEDDATDAAGDNDGTPTGGAGFAAGFVGRAFTFSGDAQHVEVPNGPALQLRSAITLEGWVQAPSPPASYAGIAGTWDDATGANRTYLFWVLNGALDFVISPDGASYQRATAPTPLAVGRWTHVAGTYDGNAIRIYVDGAKVAETPMTGAIAVNALPFTIGRTQGGSVGMNYWAGSIDELAVYGRALGDPEIAAIHAAGAAGKCSA